MRTVVYLLYVLFIVAAWLPIYVLLRNNRALRSELHGWLSCRLLLRSGENLLLDSSLEQLRTVHMLNAWPLDSAAELLPLSVSTRDGTELVIRKMPQPGGSPRPPGPARFMPPAESTRR